MLAALAAYRAQGCKMSLKVDFLHSHIDYFPENLGAYSEEQEQQFHQDVRDMERRYQGRWDVTMLADYCWLLRRETEGGNSKRTRQSIKEKKKRFHKEHEILYVIRQEDIVNHLEALAEMREIEIEEARLNDAFLSCPLCCDTEIVYSDAFTCPDGHIFCKDCIKSYVSVKFSDGVYKFACPEKCDTFFSYTALQEILPKTILSKIMKKQQVEEIYIAKLDGLECCPHCDFAYIPGSEEKIFRCQNPGCLIETCRKCGENNHIPLRCEEIERQVDVEARKKIEESMTKQLVRICPTCSKRFVKIDGCNKMVCSCGTMMCYVCRQKINDYNHFNRKVDQNNQCPLYSDNDTLHHQEVLQAGVQTKNKILQENPNIHIVHDPTQEKVREVQIL